MAPGSSVVRASCTLDGAGREPVVLYDEAALTAPYRITCGDAAMSRRAGVAVVVNAFPAQVPRSSSDQARRDGVIAG